MNPNGVKWRSSGKGIFRVLAGIQWYDITTNSIALNALKILFNYLKIMTLLFKKTTQSVYILCVTMNVFE